MTASVRRTVVADPARDTSWQDRAACLDEDPELFFPPGNEWKGHEAQEAEAKAVCNRCPVLAQCREKALADGDFEGIRGGMTGEERKALAKARKSAAAPIRHGTTTGNRAHYKRGEKPCQPCADAAAVADRRRRQAKKEAMAS